MLRTFTLAVLAGLTLLAVQVPSYAHELPWRAGEPRRIPDGSCAKKPCAYRTDWSPSRPHCHVAGVVVREKKDCERAGQPWRSAGRREDDGSSRHGQTGSR